MIQNNRHVLAEIVTPANGITALRGFACFCGIIFILQLNFNTSESNLSKLALPWVLSFIGFTTLIMDGLDGFVARKFDHVTTFGAKLDMAMDTALNLFLCLALITLTSTGMWIFLLFCWRYVFVALSLFNSCFNNPLPKVKGRKMLFVLSTLLLITGLALFPLAIPAWPFALLALFLTSFSFMRDIALMVFSKKDL